MKKFTEWLASRESSSSTRNKRDASRGLQPMYSADVFGRATPSPDIADELLSKLKKPHHKKHKCK